MGLLQDIARVVRETRLELGWSQRRLGAAARVSHATVARAEVGETVSLEALERVFDVLGVRSTFRGPAVPGGQARSDSAHRAGVAVLRSLFERSRCSIATEQAVADGSARGWIDLLAFAPQHARLLVIEVKSEVRDLGAAQRQVDLYARCATQPARAQGWHPKEVLVVLALLATEEADAFVTANRAELAATFPLRGRRAAEAMFDGGPLGGRALIAIDPLRIGRHAITSFRVDGRRTPFAFRTAADVRRVFDDNRPPRKR